MPKIHFDNLKYSSLPGERWCPVHDYDGYYEVSNLGRVRSLSRTIPHPRLYQQFVEGRILKQKVILHRNIKTGVPSVDLQVALMREGVSSYHNVRRLVYSAFVKKIDYARDGKYVVNLDGNGYNCRATNLMLVTKQEKSQLAYLRGRVVESYLKYADRSKWKKMPGASRRKPIKVIKGKKIFEYESITAASKGTGVGEKEIINVAKGRAKACRGMVFKYLSKGNKNMKKTTAGEH